MSTDRLYGMSLLLLLCNHIAMGQDARPLVDEAMNQRFKLAADLSFADRLLDIALSSQDTNTQTRGIAAILLRKDRADRYLDLLQEHIKNEDTDPQFAKDLKKIVGEIEALKCNRNTIFLISATGSCDHFRSSSTMRICNG